MAYKASPLAFCREKSKNSKGLTFSNLLLLQINGLDNGYHEELLNFFNRDLENSPLLTPSPSALCQARNKIKHEVFQHLSNSLVDDVYRSMNIKSWHGFRPIGIDGSTLHVPDTIENAEYFKGWNSKNGDSLCPKARCSLAYDLKNKFICDAQISPTSIGEDILAFKHLNRSSPSDLYVYDRYYASYKLFLEHEERGLHYCSRIPTKLFTRLCENFLETDQFDQVVDYAPTAPVASKLKKKGYNIRPLKVRLIRVTLKNGETEVLATNVMDKRLAESSFDELYNMRWAVEEEFKRLKCRAEVENFSGEKLEFVLQDFYAEILRLNLSTLLSMDAREKIKQDGKKEKHKHSVNTTQALEYISILVNKFKRHLELTVLVDHITISLFRNSLPIRNDREFEHNNKPKRAGYSKQYKRTA